MERSGMVWSRTIIIFCQFFNVPPIPTPKQTKKTKKYRTSFFYTRGFSQCKFYYPFSPFLVSPIRTPTKTIKERNKIEKVKYLPRYFTNKIFPVYFASNFILYHFSLMRLLNGRLSHLRYFLIYETMKWKTLSIIRLFH